MNFSVTKNGKELDPSLYTWDESTKTFATDESGLVLDFSEMYGVTFKTGDFCAFKTGDRCAFKTGRECTFKTGSNCAFYTGDNCAFYTWHSCAFKTGYGCTFDTGYGCIFKTGERCVIVRRDVYEVIEIEPNKKIKLNVFNVKGFEYIKDTKTITIDNMEIEISAEAYEALKKQFIEE